MKDFCIHTGFSDYHAQRENYLSKLDVRIKTGMVVMFIAMVMLSQRYFFPMTIFLISCVILRSIGISGARIKYRVLAPMSVVFFLVVIQPFIVEGHALFTLDFFGFMLPASAEGLAQGCLLAVKTCSSVTLMLCLIYTTTMDKILMAAAWLRVPSILIDISLLMYRYIFLFAKEAASILHAQKLRFGYTNFKNSMRSLAILLGMVFIRAFDQASILQNAMNLRMYRGSFKPSKLKPIPMREVVMSGIVTCLMVIVFIEQNRW